MTKPKLIALVGRAGSGKDTVARMLQTMEPFESLSFATPLKAFVREVFDFTDDQLYGPSESRNAGDIRYPRPDGTFLSPRQALQKLGTEWGRACFADVWAELGARRALRLMAEGKNVVFTDCRFVNEAAAIVKAGGEVWRIRRDAADFPVATHLSETEMNTVQMRALVGMYVSNQGGLAELESSVRRCLSMYGF